jgi:hypothetical protein
MANHSADETFEVFIDDNFHYMDEDERYSIGRFKTYGAALEKAKSIVDRSLNDLLEPGKSADELMASYVMFGEDPFIRPTPEGVQRFSARDYARQRAPEVIDGAEKR